MAVSGLGLVLAVGALALAVVLLAAAAATVLDPVLAVLFLCVLYPLNILWPLVQSGLLLLQLEFA